MSADIILHNLNASQKAAVSSAAQTLAILAGPGSGKTHTLTSRTAWLLRHEGYQPWNIIVATFTVKAAREMKERIGKLIGDGMEGKLILGTFHSIARRYLARYGYLIGIRKDFGIADSGDTLSIIKRIIKRHKLTIDAPVARSRISSRKAKGAGYIPPKQSAAKSLELQEIEICYVEYEEALLRSNLLDYDDLLLRCVDLLRAHPSCVSNVEAVLIDEFQDTNLVQFDLMRLFAAERKRVTIVGDPDQSIYGFRSAETKNFKRMITQYPDTVTIPLEENYRSSGSILLAALEVIRQDSSRIAKSLMPTHSVGTQPVLRKLPSAHVEAQWLVTEIKRCLALTGNLMTFDDVAILLRSASLSRHIESALGKDGIPYRMVGGHRFYDRVEVKIILDYLRVINQPDNNDALARIVNVPSRRIGDTTVKALLEEADKSNSTFWSLALDIVQGNIISKTKLAKQTEQGLSSFINIILTIRKKVTEATDPLSTVELIELIIRKISFEDYLEKSHPDDHETRLANVQELLNLASDFESSLLANGNDDDEALPEVEGLGQESLSNPLSKFLANIALASDAKAVDAEAAPKAQVTISTIHAAKGLEWPVVFIPAAYEGSIPHSRAEDPDEERRLLYVAMTRAKALLYMSYPLKNSQREQTALSPFLSPKSLKHYLSDKGPSFSTPVTQAIAQILRRPRPSTFDRETVLSGLQSLEDDLFRVDDGDEKEDQSQWRDRDETHHYTSDQVASKRRRLEDSPTTISGGDTRQPWRPAYATTMSESAGFSTASATVKSGFVTAGSHLQVLTELSVHCAADKYASKSKESGTNVVDGKNLALPKGTKSVSARSTRRPEGQASIAGFFTQATAATSKKTKATSTSSSCRPESLTTGRHTLQKSYSTGTTTSSSSKTILSEPYHDGIQPSLTNHRLGSSTLRAPTRHHDDDDSRLKPAYIFLSSSPQCTESLIEDAEAVDDVCRQAFVEPMHNEKKSNELEPKSRPAQTMHVTSIARMNTLNAPPPRKTLGVRRSMNGWSDRMNKGFAPPRVGRPN